MTSERIFLSVALSGKMSCEKVAKYTIIHSKHFPFLIVLDPPAISFLTSRVRDHWSNLEDFAVFENKLFGP